MKFLKGMFTVLAFAVFSSTVSANVSANPLNLTPSANNMYVSSTGEVLLTFISKTASYSNDLFLSGNPNVILNNQTAAPGATFSLGNFNVGSVLSFEMFVNTTGKRFFTGAANRNPDNILHAAFSQQPGRPLVVGFEDIYYGGDFDYDDLVFSLTNVTLVPEPDAYAMLIIGFGLLMVAYRRKNTV